MKKSVGARKTWMDCVKKIPRDRFINKLPAPKRPQRAASDTTAAASNL